MKKPTMTEIKRNTSEKQPFFFSRKTMKAFDQKMSDFKVLQLHGKTYIYAEGRLSIKSPLMGYTPITGDTIREYTGNDLLYVNNKTQKELKEQFNQLVISRYEKGIKYI